METMVDALTTAKFQVDANVQEVAGHWTKNGELNALQMKLWPQLIAVQVYHTPYLTIDKNGSLFLWNDY